MRELIFKYIEESYGAAPEYLWMKFPEYAIFRHTDNRKWFALIMNVPRNKLGLTGEEKIDIINVKLASPTAVDIALQQTGYLKGYHISRGCWVSVLLDGTVTPEEIYARIDESYNVTKAKRKPRKE